VVQFELGVRIETAQMAGRVEHVVSGEATHFQSLEALLAFLARVLRAVQERPPANDLYDLY
jgi:hypothetical protein